MNADEPTIRLTDAPSFAAFYRAHADRLLVFVTRRVYDHEVAMDLTAESFAAAFIKRRRFRGTTEAEAEAWLYAIAKRNVSRYFRRGVAERRALERLGLEVPRLDDADIERLDELAGTQGLRAAVAQELGTLSAEQRTALSLRVVDELPYDEVASRLGVSEQAARARVSRGLRHLGAALATKEALP